ncbi:beta-L-arabinofuranosidase domain-containing protein [Bacteroides sp.]|uniref:glycoside hydrolase family 127 protein n=1 Tax=Bacteroides sp. TaxID=29523 RepID=UPI00261DEDE9|nr:beta-L-arabinofuranosidase domain-containing protein [Bacteroides sp.]MDD3039162.1 glycoside hydrolase family 127 protein [Bacteroides sp.]
MKRIQIKWISFGILFLFASCASMRKKENTEILQSIPFHQVYLEDNFWLPRLKTQKEVLVPFALEKTRPAMDNLRKTGNFLKGIKDELPFPHRFIASDLYKVMEGAAYLLILEKDSVLEHTMDSIIDLIGDAQQKDGYLYEAHTTGVAASHKGEMGDKPYSWVVHSHELYNMGHMYEGAVAYYQATGKDKWLKIAAKNARHINHVFFEGDPAYNNGKPINQAPGHEEIELALVKLFQTTGDSLYLQMAKKFIDIRGVTYRPEGEGVMLPDYAQQHLPVREQTKAVGHSVRATYLYAGMADVLAQTGDETLKPALDSIWANIVDTRMHITGGLGAIHGIEGFGPEYVLPNKDAYNETCAAVGNVMFYYRMFMAEKDAKYIDVAEVALYNNVLAGVNIEGNKFFYVNPLEANGTKGFNQGRKGRSPWFDCACCPSNIARLIPQISGMMYAHTRDEIYCTLYAGTSTTVPLSAGKVNIKQETNYPFDESVHFEVAPEHDSQSFTIYFRIPTWMTNQFVPGRLYSYLNSENSNWELLLNGKKISGRVEKGFVSINRDWKKGDRIELKLPMPVRYNMAINEVEADRDRVCITKGPLVYCAEATDNAALVGSYVVHPSENQTVRRETEGLLKNIDFVTIPAVSVLDADSRQVTLVPYYAWDNRGDDAMIVWFPQTEELARASIPAMSEYISKVKASHTYEMDNVYAMAANKYPDSSSDTSVERWTSWPEKGKSQWVELELKAPLNLQSLSVYWYDDNGGVQIPKSWKLEYKSDGKWNDFPLYITDEYEVQKNQFNMVHPAKPIVADAFRLQIVPKQDAAVGILSIDIEEVK